MGSSELNAKRERYLELSRELRELCAWLNINDAVFKGEYPTFKNESRGFDLEKLKLAFSCDGPLQNGQHIKSRALREFSREWRRLIETLRLSPAERSPALKALELIGVHCWKGANNSMWFARVKK